jgi:hypothetical protein
MSISRFEDRREMLLRLAAKRRERMRDGRPRFDLTPEELRASTETSMRLARGSRQND